MQSYFIFKGMDSRTMDVRMSGPAPIVRGEERVSHVTIPGRPGELTLTEGSGARGAVGSRMKKAYNPDVVYMEGLLQKALDNPSAADDTQTQRDVSLGAQQ